MEPEIALEVTVCLKHSYLSNIHSVTVDRRDIPINVKVTYVKQFLQLKSARSSGGTIRSEVVQFAEESRELDMCFIIKPSLPKY